MDLQVLQHLLTGLKILTQSIALIGDGIVDIQIAVIRQFLVGSTQQLLVFYSPVVGVTSDTLDTHSSSDMDTHIGHVGHTLLPTWTRALFTLLTWTRTSDTLDTHSFSPFQHGHALFFSPFWHGHTHFSPFSLKWAPFRPWSCMLYPFQHTVQAPLTAQDLGHELFTHHIHKCTTLGLPNHDLVADGTPPHLKALNQCRLSLAATTSR